MAAVPPHPSTVHDAAAGGYAAQHAAQANVQSLNQSAEFFLSNYRLGRTLGIGSFGKVKLRTPLFVRTCVLPNPVTAPVVTAQSQQVDLCQAYTPPTTNMKNVCCRSKLRSTYLPGTRLRSRFSTDARYKQWTWRRRVGAHSSWTVLTLDRVQIDHLQLSVAPVYRCDGSLQL